MPRTHKRKPGVRKYRDYTEDALKAAVEAHLAGTSLRDAEKQFGIPMRTVSHKAKKKHTGTVGKPTVFSELEEYSLVKLLEKCSEWGQPMTGLDIRMIAASVLQRQGRVVRAFKNNIPGVDWSNSFLTRHKNQLSNRLCQNIKRARAEVSAETINEYFDHLEESTQGVNPDAIINYDETNLSDDPGNKKCVFKRGTKYPERIMNYSKSSTSIMFAGTASGTMLPPYTVYKAEHIWDTWVIGGPADARYNRSKSGWFDSRCSNDWFANIIVPFCRRINGPKLLIGDNLSSHINETVIELCERHNIRFVFLPGNSTHLTQPLDVVYFAPMKRVWRKSSRNSKCRISVQPPYPKCSFQSYSRNCWMHFIMVSNRRT